MADIEIDDEDIELTEDQKQELLVKQVKIEKLIRILNSRFYDEMSSVNKITKMFIENKNLYDIFDQVRQNDIHYAQIFKEIYIGICRTFAILFYTVNVSDLITQNTDDDIVCYPYEVANWFVKNVLSKTRTISEFMGIKDYFSEKVVKNFFSEYFVNAYPRELNFNNPVIDIMETGNINFPIEKVIFNFAENLYNYRRLFEDTSFCWQKEYVKDGTFQDLTGLFLINVINFFQLFFMESYLSKNKAQVRTNVKTILKAFIPEVESIVKWEDINRLIDLEKY